MNLAEYQRAFARMCLAPKADPKDVDIIGGDLDRWLLYRRMVRKRLRRVTKEGIPRTAAVLGDSYSPMFSEFLADNGVRSRFIRDAIPEFCEFLFKRADTIGRRAEDIARYEHAMWMVRDQEDTDLGPVGEFDFDSPVVVNPAHRVLQVRHPVWDKQRFAAAESFDKDNAIAVMRKPSLTISSLTLPPWFLPLLADCRRPGTTMTAAVNSLGASGALTVDAAFVDKLCDLVASAIERGLVLGSVHT
jgi:hypothetical protein